MDSKRANLTFLLFFLLGIIASAVQANKTSIFDLAQPYFQKIDTGPNIAGLWGFTQSSSGLLWVSTKEGVYTYDGYNLSTIKYRDLEGNVFPVMPFKPITEAEDNAIWVGSSGYGLFRLDESTKSFQRFRHNENDDSSLFSDRITSILPDGNGGIWVLTTKGLNRLNLTGNEIKRYNLKETTLTSPQAMTFNEQGRLLIGSEAGIFEFEVDSENQLRLTESFTLKQKKIRAIYVDKFNRIWVGTNKFGVYVIQPDGAIQSFPEVPAVVSFLPVDENQLWLASAIKGIFIFDIKEQQLKVNYKADKFRSGALGSNLIRTIFEDESGLIWIGSQGSYLGFSSPSRSHTRSITYSPSIKVPEYKDELSGLVEAPDGKFWLSSKTGGIDVFSPIHGFERTIGSHAGSNPQLPTNSIRGMFKSADNFIWISTYRSGLFRYQARGGSSTSRSRYNLTDRSENTLANHNELLNCQFSDAWSGEIFRVLQVLDGSLIAFSRQPNGVFRIRNQPDSCLLEQISPNLDLASYWATNIDKERSVLTRFGDNYLLKSGSNTVKKLELVTESDVLGEEPDLTGGYRTESGEVFFSTGNTIYQMTKLTNEKLSIKKIHSSDREVWIFDEDEQGNQWGYGVYRLAEDNIIRPLNKSDGELEGLGYSIEFIRSSDGILMNMSLNGVLLHKTSEFKPWKYQPPLLVNDIKVDGISREKTSGDLLVYPNEEEIGFYFSALDYSGPEDIKYKFILEGYSRAWSETDAQARFANYFNVPPGNYKFRLRSTNRVGDWSDKELVIAVTVHASWYETRWFRAFLIIIFTCTLYVIYLWRLRFYRSKKVELEGLVAARTEDLASSLQDLKSTQEKLVLSEKQASLGRLVNGVAHEINTPLGVLKMAFSTIEGNTNELFEAFQIDKIEDVQVSSRYMKYCSSKDLINSNIDRLSNLVDSFKKIAVDPENWRRQDFKVEPVLAIVIQQQKVQLADRNIQLSLHIDPNLGIHSSPEILRNISLELIHNAATHAFDPTEAGKISVSACLKWPEGDASEPVFILTVEDNGCGMHESLTATAFDPFTAKNPANLGLGLHVVVNLVSNILGGTIKFEAGNNSGVKFTIEIPAGSQDKTEN